LRKDSEAVEEKKKPQRTGVLEEEKIIGEGVGQLVAVIQTHAISVDPRIWSARCMCRWGGDTAKS